MYLTTESPVLHLQYTSPRLNKPVPPTKYISVFLFLIQLHNTHTHASIHTYQALLSGMSWMKNSVAPPIKKKVVRRSLLGNLLRTTAAARYAGSSVRADRKQLRWGFPLRLDVFSESPKYPMLIDTLQRHKKWDKNDSPSRPFKSQTIKIITTACVYVYLQAWDCGVCVWGCEWLHTECVARCQHQGVYGLWLICFYFYSN